ncbi:MAG TPA: hypothetical protein VF553_03240 [Pyrinomonadaceae bacterium]|jgi:hypothetical protein
MSLRIYQKATHALRYWLLRRLPTCKEIAPVMSESLERRLSLRERVLLKLHLWVCVWCAWYLDHLHLIRDALRLRTSQITDDESGESLPAATLSAEARQRIKQALSEKR